jgi:hypothetical protein
VGTAKLNPFKKAELCENCEAESLQKSRALRELRSKIPLGKKHFAKAAKQHPFGETNKLRLLLGY